MIENCFKEVVNRVSNLPDEVCEETLNNLLSALDKFKHKDDIDAESTKIQDQDVLDQGVPDQEVTDQEVQDQFE